MNLEKDLEKILDLPQGRIREEELKNIPDIFAQENLETAWEIIKTIDGIEVQCKYIKFQADILEKAFYHGWHPDPEYSNSPDTKNIRAKIKISKNAIYFTSFLAILAIFILVYELIFAAVKKIEQYAQASYLDSISNTFDKNESQKTEDCSSNKQYCFHNDYSGEVRDKKLNLTIKKRLVNNFSNKTVFNISLYNKSYQDVTVNPEEVKSEPKDFGEWPVSGLSPYSIEYYVSDNGNVLRLYPAPISVRDSWSVDLINSKGQIAKEYSIKDILSACNLNLDLRTVSNSDPNYEQKKNFFFISVLGQKNRLDINLNIDSQEVNCSLKPLTKL